jgi:hypothetical protein
VKIQSKGKKCPKFNLKELFDIFHRGKHDNEDNIGENDRWLCSPSAPKRCRGVQGRVPGEAPLPLFPRSSLPESQGSRFWALAGESSKEEEDEEP